MKNYYKIMLGSKSTYANQCYSEGFIGTDYGIKKDLSNLLAEDKKQFNHQLIPVYLTSNPGKSRIAAGLACGTTYTFANEMEIGDIVISPNGSGRFLFGQITGGYTYHPEGILPHRRAVKWYSSIIKRTEVSVELRKATVNQGTLVQITKHASEIESYINGTTQPLVVSTDTTITEDPSVFALEKHLEEFLIANWKQTELGKQYDIYEEEGELVGQQYPSDSGPIDILAISKDKKELLIIELKKGRASDNVIGQIQRYMGYVLQELAEENQKVKGIIIALEDDNRIRRALAVTNNIEFYKYEVSFKLFKG